VFVAKLRVPAGGGIGAVFELGAAVVDALSALDTGVGT
jgi:hypothetical protein